MFTQLSCILPADDYSHHLLAVLFSIQTGLTGNKMAKTAGMKNPAWQVVLLLTLVNGFASAQVAQPRPADATAATPSSVERAASGDSPDDPGPLATDISPALTHSAIRKAAHKVADWQLAHAEDKFNQQWTFAALYDGMLAASKTTGDPRYYDAMVKIAQRFDWKLLNARFPHADDMALGQSYMDMYFQKRDPVRMADTKAVLDQLVVTKDDPAKLLWWWCVVHGPTGARPHVRGNRRPALSGLYGPRMVADFG
jgi:hypothetical protein